tara:strand:+ start:574 stop:999 length:426 start_codon:yes stop_codon:yes gene_type:complete
MTNQSPSQLGPNQGIVLAPSYKLPLLISAIGPLLLLLPLNPWPTIVINIFGFFLLLQSFTLRLEFTSNELIVLQLGKELRRFPFKSWLSWKIFLPNLPGLLYFREEASPHLLPILFDPKSLEEQLKSKVGALEIKKDPLSN